MIDQALFTYIKEQLTNGFSAHEIRHAVVGAGWNADMVDEILKELAPEAESRAFGSGYTYGSPWAPRHPSLGAACITVSVAFVLIATEVFVQNYKFGHFVAHPNGESLITAFSVVALFMSVAMALIGIPVGISFFRRRTPEQLKAAVRAARGNDLYKNLTDAQIEYIHEWSWTAFFGAFVWPCGERLYLWGLGMFLGLVIPVIPLILAFRLGRDGRQLAWKTGWDEFAAYRKHQTLMSWIVALFVIIPLMITFVALPFTFILAKIV